MSEPKYLNVNVNVNGKVHKVRIQEGIGIDQTDSYHQDAAWRVKNGSLFAWEEKKAVKYNRDGEPYTEIFGTLSPKTTNELKMTEAEFALLKNVADNVNEGGDVLTLSRADIEKAQDLFTQGKFTADVTKNLPSGYHGSKETQHMESGEYLTTSVNYAFRLC